MDAATGPATARMLTLFARFVSTGFAFYLVVLFPRILSESHSTAWWWTPAAVLLMFGPACALLPASFKTNLGLIRALLASIPPAYLLGIVLWWPATAGGRWTERFDPWFGLCVGMTSIAAALIWKPSVVITVLLAFSSFITAVSITTGSLTTVSSIATSYVFSASFIAIFTIASLMAMRTARTLDESISTAQLRAAEAAGAQARTVERERFDALIHDNIMSVLLSVSRTGNSPAIVGQTRVATSKLTALRSGTHSTEALTADEMISFMRSALSEVSETLDLRTQLMEGCEETTYPAEMARSISLASAEALRNSHRHAGQLARRRIDVSVGPRSVEVRVADDGVGFDPEKVPAHRLGLAVSVHGRMRQVTGSHTSIISQPSHGCVVTLGWNRP